MSKKPEIKTEIEIGEFKGSPTLTIHDLDENGKRKPYPFSFGKKKAKAILDHIEEIKRFVNEG